MIRALAPGMAWGCSWAWLTIALAIAGALPAPVVAQGPTTRKDAAAPKKGEEPAKKADADAPEAKDAAPEKANASAPVFIDPRAQKAMEAKFATLYRPFNPRSIPLIKGMAAGQSTIDRDLITQFVEGMAHDLTDHTNIRALTDPEANIKPTSTANVALQVATDNLLDMIQTAKATNNATFQTTYNKILFEKLQNLLNSHLLSRIEAMIVLAQTGDAGPDMVGLFTRQINDPKQTVWVKLWAVRGLTNAAPTLSNDPGRASAAAKAVADFLEQEKDLPWPVQYRALEALGALRQSSTIRPSRGQPEMASVAMKFLADPQARPEVRAEAARALGMMQVSGAIGKYNFPLIAYNVGEVAANLGESINESFVKNPARSEYLAGLLISPVHQALEGSGARGSGLLRGDHPNLGANRNYIKQISDLIKPIEKASVELIRAPRGQVPKIQKELGGKVAALKGFLEKNQPSEDRLVPGGQPFPLKGANAVAGAEGAASADGAPVR